MCLSEKTSNNKGGFRWKLADLLCETVMHYASRDCFARGAEGVRFELTRPFGLPVFKTGAINRSATPPDWARAHDRGDSLLHYSATPSEITPWPAHWELECWSNEEIRSTTPYVHVNLLHGEEVLSCRPGNSAKSRRNSRTWRVMESGKSLRKATCRFE